MKKTAATEQGARRGLVQRRKAVGFTQETLAQRLGVERSTVVRWEAGKSEPSPSLRAYLAAALDVPLHELTVLLTGGSARVEGNDTTAIQSFRSADRRLGGGHLYSQVVRYLHGDVAPRLFGGDFDTESPAVFTAAAGLTELAGWMAHDAGRDDRAESHFRRALNLAKIGQDRQLVVHVMASMSHLAYHRSQPHDGVRYARAGEKTLAEAPVNPELEARIFAMQARGFAYFQKSYEAETMLERAEKALDVNSG